MARPTVMTKEVIDKLEEAFGWGCTDIEATLWADIDVNTLYLYQKKNPQFIKRKEALKERPILLARQSVLKGMKNNPDLALKFLDRRKKDEFSTKTEVDARVEQVVPILGAASKQKSDDTNTVD